MKDPTLFLRVYVTSARLAILLYFWGLPRLLSALAKTRPNKVPRDISLERLRAYTDFAVKHPPFLSEKPCLLRSLVIYDILKSSGKNLRLLVGFDRRHSDAHAGHAWLEIDQKPFFETAEDIRFYEVLLAV